MRTARRPSHPTEGQRIYAIGDVTGKLLLAHTAEAQAVVAAETIAGAETMPINYDMIPRATYCQPQIGSFGYTEAQARDKGYDVKVAKFPFTANGRARAMNATDGFVKILADKKTDKLLGAHILGPDAGTLIAELATAMEFGASAEDVARICHAHPTLSEAVQEARDHERTAGRSTSRSSRPASPSRSSVTPAAPRSSNRVLASELPTCTETIAVSTSSGAGTRSVGAGTSRDASGGQRQRSSRSDTRAGQT